MAHLLDRPSGEQMKLLTLVALGGRGGNGRLPTRQWVMLQLAPDIPLIVPSDGTL